MLIAWCFALFAAIAPEEAAIARIEEEKRLASTFAQVALLYQSDSEVKEITADVLEAAVTPEEIKAQIRGMGRRIFLFTYPCDGLKIKGYISLAPHPEGKPILYSLRGGNRLFGLMNPANRYTVLRDYTVIASAHRDGVSEGKDEFGGEDIADIPALFDYVPTLERILGLSLMPPSVYMVGGSRGGMDLFLALARYPHLQRQVDKVISLSGMLDMEVTLRTREDLVEMFTKDFGLEPGINEKEWISRRNPLLTVPLIRKDLPILIIQGTEDNRVSLAEGHHMVEALESNGNTFDYWEIGGGDHCIKNQEGIMDLMANWLEGETVSQLY